MTSTENKLILIRTDLDISWAAGFIDGEGCITAYGNQYKGFGIRLAVGQKRILPLKKLQAIFGGTIGSNGKIPLWHVQGKALGPVLREVIPYLTVKRREALLAIEFTDTIGAIGVAHLPLSVRERRIEIKNELQELKRDMAADCTLTVKAVK